MAKREVLHISGSRHDNPIPVAVRVGNMVYSSAIIGSDPETGIVPEDIDEEIRNLFHYLREIMKAAGGTTDDIAHLSVYMVDRKYKDNVNVEWLKMFPNENNRPARHTTEKSLKKGLRIQFEMTAVL
ncbi:MULTISPECIES: RidA family protein [Metasolibacillus]|uniref:RidA family protein n=1 Tax=Metasolibacillus TaxID=2703677 RepID=UPI0007961DA7|nr:RidA family protein [Metasolibacillus fluoroglycofenilyticus]KYG90965.1 enamine deaminase RidA [[Bacillus] sp. KCTC 13219]